MSKTTFDDPIFYNLRISERQKQMIVAALNFDAFDHGCDNKHDIYQLANAMRDIQNIVTYKLPLNDLTTLPGA